MAISQDLLVKHSSEYGVIVESFQKTASYMSKTHITAFLCHSHKDEKLVKGLLTWFRKEGIDIYIDWLD